jgi:hypothetical protein
MGKKVGYFHKPARWIQQAMVRRLLCQGLLLASVQVGFPHLLGKLEAYAAAEVVPAVREPPQIRRFLVRCAFNMETCVGRLSA